MKKNWRLLFFFEGVVDVKQREEVMNILRGSHLDNSSFLGGGEGRPKTI